MKTTLLALVTLFSSQAVLADYEFTNFCNDCMVPRVTCRQAGSGVDSGYLVGISSGGFAGITMATVSEESIAGSRDLSKVIVDVKTDEQNHPGLIAFNGNSFSLVVNRGEETEGYAPARLQATVGGNLIAENLVCRTL